MQLDRDLRFGDETPSKPKRAMNMTTKSKWPGALLAVAITLSQGALGRRISSGNSDRRRAL